VNLTGQHRRNPRRKHTNLAASVELANFTMTPDDWHERAGTTYFSSSTGLRTGGTPAETSKVRPSNGSCFPVIDTSPTFSSITLPSVEYFSVGGAPDTCIAVMTSCDTLATTQTSSSSSGSGGGHSMPLGSLDVTRRSLFLPVYARWRIKPLATASSAFNMELPAAPMTVL
jgi:hypothetical protein